MNVLRNTAIFVIFIFTVHKIDCAAPMPLPQRHNGAQPQQNDVPQLQSKNVPPPAQHNNVPPPPQQNNGAPPQQNNGPPPKRKVVSLPPQQSSCKIDGQSFLNGLGSKPADNKNPRKWCCAEYFPVLHL